MQEVSGAEDKHFDIRGFILMYLASSHTRIASLFRGHEPEKRFWRSCESTTFTPLVFSTFGSLGSFYSRLHQTFLFL